MLIEVRALQPWNALSPICLMVDGSVILSKLEHLKHPSGIIVTPSGMSIEVRALQLQNAYLPICLMVDGSVILSKLERRLKQYSGIIVTPSGMSIEVAYLSSSVSTYSLDIGLSTCFGIAELAAT